MSVEKERKSIRVLSCCILKDGKSVVQVMRKEGENKVSVPDSERLLPSKIYDAHLKRLKPMEGVSYRISLDKGLSLEVMPSGKKVWRYRAKNVAGSKDGAILMTLGEYPLLSLAEARTKREEIRKQIEEGKDPRKEAKSKLEAERVRLSTTLEAVATRWLELKEKRVQDSTLKAIESRLRRFVFPVLGDVPVSDISPADVLELLTSIEDKAAYVVRKVKGELTRIFSFAITLKMIDRSPVAHLITGEVLKPYHREHYKTIPLEGLPELIKAVMNDSGGIQVKSAAWLMLMLFPRKMELCRAEWSQIDFGKSEWTIPSENKKEKRDLTIPLPKQAVRILQELKPFTGERRFIFGTYIKHKDIPLGEKTLNAMLIRMLHRMRAQGFDGEMSVHGFRSLAQSWFDIQKTADGARRFSREAMERQLAHKEKGQTLQAYYRADHMAERREMLQAWADYIESVSNEVKATEMALKAA